MRLLAIVGAVLLVTATAETVEAQNREQIELSQINAKNLRMTQYDLDLPRRSNYTRPISRQAEDYIRLRIIQTGVYWPVIDDSVGWLRFACTTDTLTEYDSDRHGFPLQRFRVTVYSKTGRKIYDTNDATTILGGGGICDVESLADTTFVEVPKKVGEDAARMWVIPEVYRAEHRNIVVDRIEYNALLAERTAP
ncbi:MAG: hypothetical protein OXF27_21550 [Acidobacteria bacterium]|nr:hypothetical protein [Acidobacteriota bacterium]